MVRNRPLAYGKAKPIDGVIALCFTGEMPATTTVSLQTVGVERIFLHSCYSESTYGSNS